MVGAVLGRLGCEQIMNTALSTAHAASRNPQRRWRAVADADLAAGAGAEKVVRAAARLQKRSPGEPRNCRQMFLRQHPLAAEERRGALQRRMANDSLAETDELDVGWRLRYLRRPCHQG